MTMPSHVTIVDVGPRDGLQAEARIVPTATKIELIERLANAGVPVVEAGAFVSPKWVLQMADTADVLARITRHPGTRYPVLVPNRKGLDGAIAAGVEDIAIFGAASESFSQKNINCSISESLERFAPVAADAQAAGMRVRGYISCVLGCPYEGEVSLANVTRVARALDEMGCYEVSLGDTIGVGTPGKARAMVDAVYRAESHRVFVTMIRLLGDFDAAEEALHEAFCAALEQWPCDGMPENPRAWLVSAGRFKVIDNIRRNARFDTLDENAAENIEAPEVADANDIEDDRRRLGKRPEARAAYQCALKLIQLEPEQRFLERRLAELGQ